MAARGNSHFPSQGYVGVGKKYFSCKLTILLFGGFE